MRILGVAGFSHDPAVALLLDGTVATAIESEKVTRHKHEISLFPQECLRFVLRANGLEIHDLDFIATNWDGRPRSNFLYLRQALAYLRRNCYPWQALATLIGVTAANHRASFAYWFGERLPPIVPIRHHLAHLGSCYTLSPFDEAAVAVIDGSGEHECTSLYHCRGREVRKLYSMDLPVDSLGHLYLMTTLHLGHRMGDEYKVMGLAAYGERNAAYETFFREVLQLLPQGRYRVNARMVGAYLNHGFRFPRSAERILGHPRDPAKPLTDAHRALARALQTRIEEAVLHVVRGLRNRTRCRRLCLAGGVALNCVANARIRAETDFEEIFIQPAAHDGGTSLGAAAFLHYHILGKPRPEPMRGTDLGPAYNADTIERTLNQFGLAYERVEEVEEAAAEALCRGRVIGWFQGRLEFGPRALGNRSILADPRDAKMKDRVNYCVKERESYRPFAPAVKEESMSRYFVGLAESPFMVYAARVRPEKQAEIPAVVHHDGTARVQSVSRARNPRFHRLLDAFEHRTGVPVLLNTSFNVAGEPIVMSPAHAIRTFFGSGLNALFMDHFMVLKAAGGSEQCP